MIRPDEFAPIQKSRVIPPHNMAVFLIVVKLPALPNRGLIIYPLYAVNQSVIQLRDASNHASFGRSSDILSRLLGQVLLPPVPTIGQPNCRDVIPFDRILIPGSAVGQSLRKSEDIGWQTPRFVPEPVNVRFRICNPNFQPVFIMNRRYLEPSARDNQVLALLIECRHLSPLSSYVDFIAIACN